MGGSFRIRKPKRLHDLDGLHGSISFSPTKGYSCSLMCQNKMKSWVTAQGETIEETVYNTLVLKQQTETKHD